MLHISPFFTYYLLFFSQVVPRITDMPTEDDADWRRDAEIKQQQHPQQHQQQQQKEQQNDVPNSSDPYAFSFAQFFLVLCFDPPSSHRSRNRVIGVPLCSYCALSLSLSLSSDDLRPKPSSKPPALFKREGHEKTLATIKGYFFVLFFFFWRLFGLSISHHPLCFPVGNDVPMQDAEQDHCGHVPVAQQSGPVPHRDRGRAALSRHHQAHLRQGLVRTRFFFFFVL
jgi:hypothetical protein